MIAENLKEVRKRIANAAKRTGRDPSEITLICVSKTKPLEMIKEAYELGERCFGENKPQELRDKAKELTYPDICWHMIGTLQKNKIKYVVPASVLIHSVDSVELARDINAEAGKKGVIADILLEINVAGETTKHGFLTSETLSAVCEIARLENLRIRGLMTVAPDTDDPEENRPYFKAMRDLLVDINSKNIDNVGCMNVLSMGMTNDYETAVEEGSTMVRIGTGIFGERNYNKI